MRLSEAVPYVVCGAVTAGALALLLGPPSPAAASAARPTDRAAAAEVHEVRADFHEDEHPSRVVGALAARLTRTGRGARFELVASALGPRVVPPPGFEGVTGGNEIAARELRSLLAGDRCTVRVRRSGPGAGRGHVLAGRAGRVPSRRLGADGAVREGARPGDAGPVEAVFVADLPAGEAIVEVEVDGRVRARASCRVSAAEVRILSLGSVTAHASRPGAP